MHKKKNYTYDSNKQFIIEKEKISISKLSIMNIPAYN